MWGSAQDAHTDPQPMTMRLSLKQREVEGKELEEREREAWVTGSMGCVREADLGWCRGGHCLAAGKPF